jgi:hypothetical protein
MEGSGMTGAEAALPALKRVVTYAHDVHLSKHHPEAHAWMVYEGCAMCSDLAVARDAAGIGMHTRRVPAEASE